MPQALLLLAVLVGLTGCSSVAELPPAAPPLQFAPELVAKGRQLAAIGNCNSCHTLAGGAPYAGGVPVLTPFGTIYGTNITPHPRDGIGRWSEAAFARALRQGVDRSGRHLYPAFPYTHYRLLTDDDISALYAFVQSLTPAAGQTPPNELPFYLKFRPLLALWKKRYLEEEQFQPQPERDAEYNRGAYLAEGLAHCGACHTPRDWLGGPRREQHWAGGESAGWTAYPINRDSLAPVPWTRAAMAFYLRYGWHAAHGVARGPMAEVTDNLGRADPNDVDAIAAYTLAMLGGEGSGQQPAVGVAERGALAAGDSQSLTRLATPAEGSTEGAGIFAAACASCHNATRPQPYGGLGFDLSTAVRADDPQNIINVTLFGLPPRDGERSAVMPGYAAVLTDRQLAEVLKYLRAAFTDLPAWSGLTEQVAATRAGPARGQPGDSLELPPVLAEERQ